jgi:hypothetical protein
VRKEKKEPATVFWEAPKQARVRLNGNVASGEQLDLGHE